MPAAEEEEPRQASIETWNANGDDDVHSAVSFSILPRAAESSSWLHEYSRSIVYSDWFETDTHIR